MSCYGINCYTRDVIGSWFGWMSRELAVNCLKLLSMVHKLTTDNENAGCGLL
jgi:hypothetical protein